jgi:CRP-like cAMP-binding protein
MVLKRFFGGSQKPTEAELTIEDLIVLERYDEAIERLEEKAKKNPKDLHSHLRLAEVYVQVRQGAKALDQYLYVAECYAEDGFHDKGIALLSKAAKIWPADDNLRARLNRMLRMKQLEQSRAQVVEGLFQSRPDEGPLAQVSAAEVQRIWQKLADSALVQRLPGDQLKRLFSGVEIFDYPRGAFLGQRATEAPHLFVIVQGVVEATAPDVDGKEVALRTFTTGDILGESAMLERRAWPVTLRATEPVRTLRMNREGLERALTGNSDPKMFLDVLRSQGNDRALAVAAQRINATRS